MKVLAENRRARFDYEILESFDAGISLLGFEVKSVKTGHMGLNGSYAILREGQVELINAQIPPYQVNNTPVEYESSRTRKLLLTKKEIAALTGRLKEKGLSLIPLNVHLKKNLVKVELGLARARKKSDKRDYLKEREHKREMDTF